MSADITIYTKAYCPYCASAKTLLKAQGQMWKEIDVENDEAARNEMIERSGGLLTVPQIFINGAHIGGFDALRDLNEAGKLAPLLQ